MDHHKSLTIQYIMPLKLRFTNFPFVFPFLSSSVTSEHSISISCSHILEEDNNYMVAYMVVFDRITSAKTTET